MTMSSLKFIKLIYNYEKYRKNRIVVSHATNVHWLQKNYLMQCEVCPAIFKSHWSMLYAVLESWYDTLKNMVAEICQKKIVRCAKKAMPLGPVTWIEGEGLCQKIFYSKHQAIKKNVNCYDANKMYILWNRMNIRKSASIPI